MNKSLAALLFTLILISLLGASVSHPASAAPSAKATPTAKPNTKPTATAVPKKPVNPVRIVIESIGLDRKIVSVGLDKQRMPIVPDHDVGWYNLSARPGTGENIVLWGHVLRFRTAPKKPAPFANLKNAKVGDRVVLYDSKGKAFRYTITQQIWAKPDQVEYILPVGSERVTMVSCIGSKVISGGEVVDMSNRLITIAEPEK